MLNFGSSFSFFFSIFVAFFGLSIKEFVLGGCLSPFGLQLYGILGLRELRIQISLRFLSLLPFLKAISFFVVLTFFFLSL